MRGKVLGGSSSINVMVFTRGQPSDYERRPQKGARGWSYDDVLPYFKRCETWQGRANYWRGGGPVGVEWARTRDRCTRRGWKPRWSPALSTTKLAMSQTRLQLRDMMSPLLLRRPTRALLVSFLIDLACAITRSGSVLAVPFGIQWSACLQACIQLQRHARAREPHVGFFVR
jgi:hypothetical protein